MKPAEVLENRRALLRELSAKAVVPVKIALLSGSTIGDLENLLRIYLLAYGLKPEFFVGQYDRWYEDAAFENIALRNFKPDIVYIHTTVRNLLEDLYDRFETAWRNISDRLGCIIIQNNLEMLPFRVMGNKDCSHADGKLRIIADLNQKIADYAESNQRFYINDIHWLSANIGLERWFDDAYFYMYKYACSAEALVSLALNVAKIVKSLFGLNKKAIAVDLDNTLWGGVVGDDGAENLEQSLETPRGMAFWEFQKYLKGLSKLGVLLNVTSKNDARLALQGLEYAYLKREAFVEFEANWNDKHKNLANIAKTLNLGLDSLVFIDDNPAEREIVRQFLPDVEVVDILEPENYVRELDSKGYFEVTAMSEDDQKRVSYYKNEQKRREVGDGFSDYSDYLTSLEMVASFEPINEGNISRTVQLINKTNQFNLTTKRYTENGVLALIEDDRYLTLTGKLQDKFGDNGLVTVIIASICNKNANIELWIMSCRVFKRGLEFAAFGELVRRLKARGVEKIIGLYYPTEKNKIVENLYHDLGFAEVDGHWEIGIDDVNIPNIYMEGKYDEK